MFRDKMCKTTVARGASGAIWRS